MRKNLDDTLIVVTYLDAEGNEVEVAEIDANAGMGNLDSEASQSMAIGIAVRKALLLVGDGEAVEVRSYYR
ncbi:hypothetical protein Sp245p_03380 [Azospirillum baldaniorum]|uniref:Uncharacterized protein n=1 Tax=Azospirillum baldaniorum TaxID=1064539 RepID=A0A9P1NNK1_9PROT|nr:hypothetical protein [Azospirillum baldaniorum]AWJ88896.1 hypothetical protein Sp245p_03380 [Azospirillum baldaniorum]TWA73393.1 hypothetical protein FBZ85_11685 [Azospirillum brasilense]CCC99396.1 protein of unknown function [Azospirillum baldaniorum]